MNPQKSTVEFWAAFLVMVVSAWIWIQSSFLSSGLYENTRPILAVVPLLALVVVFIGESSLAGLSSEVWERLLKYYFILCAVFVVMYLLLIANNLYSHTSY